MKKLLQPILIWFASAFFYLSAIAQAPANDECSGAIAITTNPFGTTCTSPTAANTVNASPSSPAPSCATAAIANDDIWYTFTANSASVIVRVSNAVSIPSGIANISMEIYSGTCGNLSSVTCVNGFAFSAGFRIVNGLTIGNTYSIRFWTTSTTNSANFNFCIQDVPSPPVNDECVGAIPVTTQPFGTSCSQSVVANTTGATRSSPDPSCTSIDNNDDIWYSFTANSQSIVLRFSNTIETTDGTSGNLGYALYNTACPSTSATVSCNNNIGFSSGLRIIDGLTIGNTYLLRLYGLGSNSYISFNFCIQDLPAPPANDECVNAIPIFTQAFGTACTTPVFANTTASTHSNPDPSCGINDSNDDIWYSFTANSSSIILRYENANLTTINGFGTLGYALYSGACPSSSTTVSCSAGFGFANGFQIINGLVTGTTYYLRLFSQSVNNYMSFEFCIQDVPSAPANDDCTGAIPINIQPFGTSCNEFVSVNTTGATHSLPDPPCGVLDSNDDLWYRFVANSSSVIFRFSDAQLTTSVGSATVGFAVYEGNCPTGSSSLICNANAGFSSGIQITNGLTIGNTYQLRVFSQGPNNYLSFNFCIQSVPAAPVNDDCQNAIPVALSLPGTNCTSSVPVNTTGASPSANSASCIASNSNNDDLWYSFVANANSAILRYNNCIETTSSNFASIGYALYNSCPTNSSALICVNSFGFRNGFSNITGLIPGNTYLIRLFSANPNNYVSFGFCIQSPLQNDDCNNAISIPVTNGFCTSPILGSLNGATTSAGFGAPSCAISSSSKDVWFTVIIPTTGNVIIQSSAVKQTANDLVMTAYIGTCTGLSEIACDDDGNPDPFPSQDHSRITLTGRAAGETIYIRVCPKTSSNEEQFVICAWDESVSVLPVIAPSGNCDPAMPVTIDSSNANLYRWVPIFNNNQQIIAEIYGNGNELGSITSKLFVNTGIIRQYNSQYYLDRNTSIASSLSPQSSVSLRLYFTQSELSALMNVNPSVTGRGSLKIIKTNTDCEAAISGTPIDILQQSNASYGDNHLLQFSTNSFSNFYIDGFSGTVPLRFIGFIATAANRTVSLKWTVEKDPELLFFEIQRSIDGIDFETIDTLSYGAYSAESSSARIYTWNDEQKPDSDSYYRIKMIGANNQILYSRVEIIRKKQSPFTSARVYPNPAKDYLYVNLTGFNNEKVVLTLADLQGRIAYQKRELNSTNRIFIDIQAIPYGLYTLRIYSPTSSITTKFIKQ